jgi:peptide/nickel transport system permease protein
MTSYVIRRLVQGLLVMLVITILVFLALRLLPSDPLSLYIFENDIHGLSESQLHALRVEYGLDKTPVLQYLNWLSQILQGNLGSSLVYHDSVGSLIVQRIPPTLHLGIMAFILSGLLGILAGVISALRRGGWIDNVVTFLANFGITAPSFWIGLLLVYIFSNQLQWLPVQGYTSPFKDFWLNVRQVIMPTFCLSFAGIASIARQTRSSVLEVSRQDYIRTAFSKGLTEYWIVIRHILKNSLIPVITLQAFTLSQILGGSVIIETVFNIPGMGRLMVDSIFARDYPIVQNGVLLIAAVVVLTNLIVDISYGWLDPRIRYR